MRAAHPPRRTDLDGLRGLAVMMVVLAHAHAPFLPGGFTGVDIFFVLSGYLITHLLMQKDVSVAEFYWRRALRIVPALFVMVAVVLVAGWVFLLPDELMALANSAVASLFFVSNAHFWAQSGYFAPEAGLNPLLHTWTLSVEAQFYFGMPLLLFPILARTRGAGLAIALGAAVLAAFALAEVGQRIAANASYFAAPTRAFALLAGAFVAVIAPRRSTVAAAIGLLMIALGAVVINGGSPYPSAWTLLPVVGTALVLLCADRTPIAALLSIRPLVALGLISFGVYLWHQPLFAFARIIGDPGKLEIFALTLVSLILGTVSLFCVERPCRRVNRPLVAKMCAGAAGITLVAASGALLTGGGLDRYAPADRALAALDPAALGDYVRARFSAHAQEKFANDGRQKLLLIGDSFSEDLTNTLHEAGALKTLDLVTVKIPTRCGTVWSKTDVSSFVAPDWRRRCPADRGFLRRTALIKAADRIVLAARWQPWQARYLPETVARLKEISGAPVVLVAAKSFGTVDRRALLKTPAAERITLEARPDQATLLTRTALGLNNLPVVDLPVCPNAPCRLFTAAGELISYDGAHLTPAGARDLGTRLTQEELATLLGPSAPLLARQSADVRIKGRF